MPISCNPQYSRRLLGFGTADLFHEPFLLCILYLEINYKFFFRIDNNFNYNDSKFKEIILLIYMNTVCKILQVGLSLLLATKNMLIGNTNSKTSSAYYTNSIYSYHISFYKQKKHIACTLILKEGREGAIRLEGYRHNILMSILI